MATFYSITGNVKKWRFVVAILAFAAGTAFADGASNQVFAARAKAEFQRTESQYRSTPQVASNAVSFARACFDYADFAPDDKQRAAIASQGIDACRQVIARDPQNAAAHYYLAMDLGQLARTETIGALKLVREMETEFKTALDLDSRLDFGGPARGLGLLYRDAPGWPASIGSKRKAKNYLEQAAKIAPDFPENILNLAETDLKWRDRDGAKKQMDALDVLWPVAKTNFPGEAWERDWADWTDRRQAAQKKLDEFSPPLKPPRSNG